MNESYYETALVSAFPKLARSTALSYISQDLYPPIYDGSQGYKNPLERVALTISEVFYACNAYYLGRAYENSSYGYQFSIPPGLHGQDLPYTFFTGLDPGPDAPPLQLQDLVSLVMKYGQVGDPKTAVAWQQFMTSFAQRGTPTGRDLPASIAPYGRNDSVMDFNVFGVGIIKDPAANRRCEWWQKGLYL